ncbi:RmlC-like cupin [Apiospora marii]|uniref:RmlC-like cupin n=1 Tax=Apiospora marii TaxID=335849 RepID=UPI00312D9EED
MAPPTQPQPSQPVRLAQAADLQTSGGQTDGMLRQNAITDLCDGICASRMIAKPHSSSAVHHHGAQDTIVVALSGRGTVVSEGGHKRVDLQPGDFCLIPAWAEHQEVNEGDEDVVWGIVRSGRAPEVVNLTGWGGGPASDSK